MAETTIEVTHSEKAATRLAKPINWGKVFTYTVLLFGVILMIFPFLWMVSASLMSLTEVTFGKLIPSQPLFSNYAEAFQRANFGQFMWNSARLTVITLTGQMLVCIPAAYAFARMRFVGRNVLFTMMLATIMIPEVARFIPNYLTVIWLGRLSDSLLGIPWINNWPSLTIPFMAVPFTIFLLRQFFMQLPEDLWDAARIDGAGHVRFLRSVVIPLSTAPIMTAITFGFIGSWNSLLWPLLLTQTDDWRPVAVGLTKFVNSDAPTELHLQMAASVLMIIPILILYFFTQRQFTEGIATTGLKG
jgi:ABC-type glycerol-3-phosphate transport system permease component